MSRTLSCKSNNSVNTRTVLYKCQELFPANHTIVSTPGWFFTNVKNSFLWITQMCQHDCFYMSRTLSCKSNNSVNMTTVFANVTNCFLQIIQICQNNACSYKWHKVLPANYMIKFDMDRELQLLTSYFLCSVSNPLGCQNSDPLKQDFRMTTIPVNTTRTCDTTVQWIGNNGLDQCTSTFTTLTPMYGPMWHHHPLYYNHKISHPENPEKSL